MTNESIKGSIVKEYLLKYPSLGSRKIASLIYKDNKEVYDNEELIRNIVRYYRGSHGEINRNKLTPDTYLPKINLPYEDDYDFSPYLINNIDNYPILLAGDIHIPYYDQDALEIFIERIIDFKPKTIILAGDWIDFYAISKWQHNPRKRSVKDEIDLFNYILDQIVKAANGAKIIYKYGNHEERFDNYIMNKAPELFELETIHLDNVLKLKERGIELVKDKRIIRINHLNVIHGHEYIFSISNPVNPARGLFNRAKKTSLCFHFHQTSEHTEPTISGEVISAWSSGCLANLHPEYMPLNKWNHGFVEITNEDNFFNLRNRKIINYKLL